MNCMRTGDLKKFLKITKLMTIPISNAVALLSRIHPQTKCRCHDFCSLAIYTGKTSSSCLPDFLEDLILTRGLQWYPERGSRPFLGEK
uniref:Uncharacterized protein n=1 Tax=Amphimedon queenslandica TaxID=400682 RepID=A0A1X7TRP3_AMPQE